MCPTRFPSEILVHSGTTFLPSGAKLTLAMRKQPMPNGMPIIVQQHSIPAITALSQSHIPANTTQITFSANVHTPAFSLATTVRPNGKNAKPAMRKHATPYGMPIIVHKHTMPQTIHSSPSQRPPSTNHMILPIKAIFCSFRCCPLYHTRAPPQAFLSTRVPWPHRPRCFVHAIPAVTSHGDASGSRGSPRRLTSSRTRCTCCRQGRAGESDPGHTRIRARSSPNRTIRSASRRPGARESGLSRTRIHARSSSNRNVCILSPCQFSFPLHSIPHPNCRRRHKCDVSRVAASASPFSLNSTSPVKLLQTVLIRI